MWDTSTKWVVVIQGIIWLKRIFFQAVTTGILELEEEIQVIGDVESQVEVTTQLGGKEMLNDPIITGPTSGIVMHSGHAIKPLECLMYTPVIELHYLGEMVELDHAELTAMYMTLWSLELALVEAGIRGGIEHTSELKVLNYRKAMQSPDAEEWHKKIRNEKVWFNKYSALMPVPWSSLPQGSKVLTTMWAMKMKSNGTYHGRLNARGYEQVDGSHYTSDSIAMPVTNPIKVRIILMLFCMNLTWMSNHQCGRSFSTRKIW